MEIKAVIFDMDGLMFDTEKLWLDSVIMTNKVYGYSVPEELVISCIGLRKDKIDAVFKENFGQDFDTDEFRRLNKLFMKKDVEENGLRTKKGLNELLEYLKTNGYKIGIASSSKMERVEERFVQSGLSNEPFEVIISGDMVDEPKPCGDVYRMCCEKLDVSPSEAIALEDSESGLLSAIDAGVRVIWIPDIKMPSEDVLKKAYKKLDSLDKVIDVLEEEKVKFSGK